MGDYNWYDWMHPSWRDMVIEFLVANGTARQHFLSKCGVNGFMLALSGGGGAKGQRKSPLLIEASDWTAMETAVARIIVESERWKVASVLSAVLEALNSDLSGKDGLKVAKPPLAPLALKALDACRSRWNQSGREITARLLELYREISEYITPLPPTPDIMPSWDGHWKNAKMELENFDEDKFEVKLSSTDEWLDLCLVLPKIEPRLLHQVQFPQEYIDVFSELLPRLEKRLEFEEEFETAVDCENERDKVIAIKEVAEKISSIFSELEEAAKEIEETSDAKSDSLRDKKEEFEANDTEKYSFHLNDEDKDEATNPEENEDVTPNSIFLMEPQNDEIDLVQLFEDL